MVYQDEGPARPDVEVVAGFCGGIEEYFITATSVGGSGQQLFEAAAEAVDELDVDIVCMEIFGVSRDDAESLASAFGPASWPVTWIEEGADETPARSAVQVWAVGGAEVTPLEVNGKIVGTLFQSEHVRCCRLGGLVPTRPSEGNGEQTREVLEMMVGALGLANMKFSDVLRTWFYNYKMLDWYDEFNAVRTNFFSEHKVFDGLVPASTCVGGRNVAGAALTAGLVAFQGLGGEVAAMAVGSPLQCPAPQYGSSFSRASELKTSDMRRLYISGTASIALEGQSIHIGDVEKQVERTMEVVDAILKSCDMDWANVTRAIGYYKDINDIGSFERYCQKAGLPSLPIALVKEDICRDDLLFEIELDVIKN